MPLCCFQYRWLLPPDHHDLSAAAASPIILFISVVRLLPLSMPSSGPVASDICSSDGASPLSDLLISFNSFSGVLNVSNCLNLVLLSAEQNDFTDFVNPTEYNRLHTVRLGNNTFPNNAFTELLENIMDGGHVTNLDISWNR